MRSFVARRLLFLIPVVFLVTLISFFLIYLSPGDPADALLTQNGGAISTELVQQKREELGLDRPLWEQYFSWIAGICQGDLGDSIMTGRPVIEEIGRRFPATIFLAVVSLAVTLLVSIPLGILTAVKQNKFVDYFVRALSFFVAAMPGFLVALLLVYVFALQLHLLPSLGSLNGVGWILPVATLVLCESASFIRQIRTMTIQELGEGYVMAQRVRGLPERSILFRSVLKAIAPTILVLTGLSLGHLLGGTAIIETVFAWPGVGKYAVEAIMVRDYPVIQGYILIMALMFVLVNLIVDVIHAKFDPRARVQWGEE